ncbi:regulator of G protein signaling domain protein [Ceratobasidium sp. AG-Ba]|nr:regulator of G protein signaling domain protein [Ceratobasidium sp. AG-Ba]
MPDGARARPPRTKPTRRRGDEKKPRPPPHWFTLGTLRSFPQRIAHPPPPAVGERYFLFDSTFRSRRCSPTSTCRRQLSLQDFEDYLQHVEGKPENLYFHLWLQHYRRVHGAWANSVLPTVPGSSNGVYRSRDLWERLAPCQDRQLRDEFTFAKTNFFDDDAPMRLGISDEIRRNVMHIGNVPPQESDITTKLPSFPNQPEPGHFDAVLEHVNTELAAAFERFLRLAFCNSGLWHSCLGHLLGVAILAGGLALWCTGVVSAKGRGYVAGSLPLIWVGVWFMLVSLNGHCLGVYVTGDARQLYPHEFLRPIPPDAVPPPVYSVARPSEEGPPPYASSRKPSGASGTLLPTPAPVTLPPHTHQPWKYFNGGRRKSEAVGKRKDSGSGVELKRRKSELARMFGRRIEEDLEAGAVMSMDQERRMRETAEMSLKLPPARKTKDLPRQSLAMDVFPTDQLPAPPPAVALARRGAIAGIEPDLEARFQVSFQTDELPTSPEFTEENDFGIVVSEAFDEDDPHPYLSVFSPQPMDEVSAVAESGSNPTTVDVPTPMPPGPEYLAQRRMTMPDIFAPARSGNDIALDWVLKETGKSPRRAEGSVMWPWPRRLLGPMTAVHSPVVRRAHWVVTVRCALVALVATAGMAFGMI